MRSVAIMLPLQLLSLTMICIEAAFLEDGDREAQETHLSPKRMEPL